MERAFLENFRYLQELIDALSYGRKFYICIHDAFGAFENNPVFMVDPENMLHHTHFCRVVKTSTKGLSACAKCKIFSVLKASRSDGVYVGKCYLGIGEIVSPVFYNGKLLCIIYFANLSFDGDMSDIMQRIKKYHKILGLSEKSLTSKLHTIDVADKDKLEEYLSIVAMLKQSIIYAYKSTHADFKKENSELEGSRHFIVDGAKAHIHSYYALDIKIEHIAQLYFISPNYLRNLFKKYTGYNFTEYLNRFRIEEAVKLLQTTSDSVIEISVKVGFNNVTYFNKLIKRYKGMTPKEFRGNVTLN